ncbi:MAG TPA: UDP-N-acetylglucosamine 1-carboxyvinyltransferase, partial [Acidimicrobiales bacterium]|nr:UDP-N-acetylglucosamine 1-carboxyvinyltransferase [Acidimicrobiales bacterium]
MPSPPSWEIEPAGPLRGDVRISGSKNAVTKLMVAALLGNAPSTIANAPLLGDVDITAAMLRSLGAGVTVEDGEVTVEPSSVTDGRIPVSHTGLNRVP